MIKRVIEFLIYNWNTYFPDAKKPENVSFLQLCGDADYGRTEKIEVFLFFNGERAPSLVAIFGRDPQYSEILQNEYASLKKLHSVPAFLFSIPRPIFYEKIGISHVLVITCLPGRTMEQMTIKKRQARKKAELFLGMMTEGLVNLNCNTSSGSADIYPYAENLLNEYQIYYPSHKEYIGRMLALMKDMPAKTTFTHGNPAAGNILVCGDKLSMVDWAAARERGLPLSDLFIFLSWYGANYFRTGDFTEDYRMTFFDSNPFSSAARNMVYYYCERTGIDKKFILPLFYLTWLGYAVRKFKFMAVNSGCEASLLDYNRIATDIVKHIWGNFPEPNRDLPLLHISGNSPVNIQMLLDEEGSFIL